MSPDLQSILNFIRASEALSKEQKDFLLKAVNEAGNGLKTALPNSSNTAVEENPTPIFLNEILEELEQKRKAVEVQSRELKVEAALERVRARTMAMQKSHELSETAVLLFHQLMSLGLDIRGCGFNIWEKDEKTCTAWMSGPEGRLSPPFKLPLTDDPFFIRYYESRQNGEDFWVYETGKEELVTRYKYLQTLPVIGELLAKEQKDGMEIQLPPFVVDHAVNFSNGNLIFITYKSCPEAWDIFKRFGKVFEQTYTRFLDLEKAEAQAREAQIELGLERVRARAMAMRKSEELKELIVTVSTELSKLDIILDRCFIITYDIQTMGSTWWMSNPEIPSEPIGLFVKYHEDWPYLAHINAWKERKIKWQYILEGEVKKAWDRFLFCETELSQLPDFVIENMRSKEKVYLSSSFNNFGYLTLATLEPLSDEQFDIMLRFAKVFDLTYTRFNDLKQAEAQARESQIQLALERVRARTMAMQKSDELIETAVVLFNQLNKLGENIERTIIGVMNEKEQVVDFWATRPGGSQMDKMQSFPIDEPIVMQKVYAAWRQQKKSIVIDLRNEELEKYFQFLKGRNSQLNRESFGERRVENFTFYSKGFLGVINADPKTPANVELYERFAAVFEQTYTRFLDLQKAEAQARESQIQLALERVRAKALAMQTSHDLIDVANVLREQMGSLGQPELESSIVHIYNNGSETFDAWYAYRPPNLSSGEIVNGFATVEVASSAWSREVMANYKSTDTEYTIVASGEKLLEWYNVLQKVAPVTVNYDDNGQIIVPDILYYHFSNFSGGSLLMISTVQPSAEARELQKRAAVVFDLAYTRFLDLQKAEAQAKEATIEAALERVRGKAMAMHNSNDLTATASLVFTELRKLGIDPVRCGVSLQTKESRKNLLYYAIPSAEGDNLSLAGTALLEGHPVLSEVYDSWVKGEDYFPVLEGESLISYYQVLKQVGFDVPASPAGHEQHGYYLAFSEGMFYGWAEKPFTESEIKILKRFASVIDLTFRRYMELQKSEASAKEAIKQAALDRIRADIASMRTIADLERITPLIWNELTILGVPFIRCGIFIMDDLQQLIHTFLSTPEGRAIAAFHLPYTTPGNISQVLKNWHDKKIYTDHWDESAFTQFAEILVEQGALASAKQYLQTIPHGGFYLHFLPFLQGMLYVGNTTQLDEEEIKLIQSVADAFSTAYAR
ncbi:MAG TPA: hypothetical protein VM012_03550, partial [Flavitalea sp.]|nr:hypothetical protein [Flavitalea sp.]